MAGDRKCYQLPPFAKGLARRAINRDAFEGADILMVKPALPYLDIIQDCATLQPDLPTACYQVSGEFAMIHAGATAGVYDLRQMAEETVGSMMRAGEWAWLFNAQCLKPRQGRGLRGWACCG